MKPSEIRETAERIAEQVLRGEANQVDIEAHWPKASITALLDSGLGGLTVPKSYGGLDGGLLSMVEVSEILAKECGSAAMCFGMHCVGSAVISAKTTDKQASELLSGIVKGKHLTTLALSEPGTGAHFYIPQARMTRTADGAYELNGAKSFVTNGSHADSYVMSAVADDDGAPVGSFSMLVVPGHSAGLAWQQPWQGFGMRGNASSNVELKSVKVSQSHLLGEEGDQIWYVFEVIAPYFLMAMAGTYLGIADAAIKEAINHLGKRQYAFNGSSLGNVTILQHRLGTLWSRLESTRQLVYHAAKLGDSADPGSLPAILSAKAEVGDCVTLITNEVMTLMGGKGYSDHGNLGRLLRDARAAHVMSPTTDMLRTWTGRALLGLPLLSEG